MVWDSLFYFFLEIDETINHEGEVYLAVSPFSIGRKGVC
jgi:hypothetical protein